MEWAPIPTDLFRIPALLCVGSQAALLHISGVLYLYEMELPDGVIPGGVVRGLCPLVRQPDRTVKALTTKAPPGESPLWTPVRGGFFIADWEWWEERLTSALRVRARDTSRKRKVRERRRHEGTGQGLIEFPEGRKG